MSRLTFLILFIILISLDLFQVYTDGLYRVFTKPLILISLIIYYLSCFKNYSASVRKYVFLTALVAALAGDTFLLSEAYFLHGLGAFLVMQLLYSYCFYKDLVRSRSSLVYTVCLFALMGIVITKLWPSLGDLKIPVIIYMSAIAMMSLTAFSRNKNYSGYWWIFIGTLLFIVSDTVLGIHQFDVGVNLGKLTVMSTYASAQYAIVQGYMDRGLS